MGFPRRARVRAAEAEAEAETDGKRNVSEATRFSRSMLAAAGVSSVRLPARTRKYSFYDNAFTSHNNFHYAQHSVGRQSLITCVCVRCCLLFQAGRVKDKNERNALRIICVPRSYLYFIGGSAA